jgi:hypothetical protein
MRFRVNFALVDPKDLFQYSQHTMVISGLNWVEAAEKAERLFALLNGRESVLDSSNGPAECEWIISSLARVV